ncbi:MAG: PTS sugar transporter subunit IIA [Bifidobacteriaceae bacterium]|jgi:PTS system N-acetylgalactosamine-specific IIA component|nr:PTS sugar transporter subunit IIA [Bifidobacteriaceae bacterium]
MKLGFIITGHGHFASGLYNAVELIAGEQKLFEVVEFLPQDPLEDLKVALQFKLDQLLNQEKCDEVIFFVDLMGGTPFRTAMEVAHPYDNVEVLAGISLTLVIEAVGARMTGSDIPTTIKNALEAGHNGMIHAQIPKASAVAPEPTEGI